MTKETSIYLDHILESILLIEKYSNKINKSKFLRYPGTQDKIIRRLEIIGEASKKISESFKKDYPNIPWRKIAGMRDKLIHDYFEVDLDLARDTVKKDIPMLKNSIKKIKSDYSQKWVF